MPNLNWDERRDIRRLEELNRLGMRGFAGRTTPGSSYATDEDTSIDWPYRRVIGAKVIRLVRSIQAARGAR
jgi:hypothetical protein